MAIKAFWEVGGHVRDSFLGIESKDIDCAVECDSFQELVDHIEETHKKIFLIKEDCLTIRAIAHDGLVRDYVMCRKDGAYGDGRRPDSVEPGTILDDLARRDFTVNAIARKLGTGEILDPYNGREDLKNNVLRCVGTARDRFFEDPLRIIRALRFIITKGFTYDEEIENVLHLDHRDNGFGPTIWEKKIGTISRDRVREELLKMFKHDTMATLNLLWNIDPDISDAIFGNDIWLKPTTESR